MLIDADKVPDHDEVECDICIVGAGAAGLALAQELASTKLRIVVLEGGGLDFDPASQDLYKGVNVGRNYYDLDICRLRYFGGTTNHWAGWCAPLSDSDFLPKDWVPHSGWPLSLTDLLPYYEAAHAVCELGNFDYSPAQLPGQSETEELLPWDSRRFETKVYRFSPPTRFGEVYRPLLERSSTVQLRVHANAVSFDINESRSAVFAISGSTLNGRKFKIRAKNYVLAAGGIENARLLLHSNIGNEFDLVGRFFMEHPEPTGGLISILDPYDERWTSYLSDYPGRETLQPFGSLTLPYEVQRAERLLGCGIGLNYIRPARSQGWTALRKVYHDLPRGRFDDLGTDIQSALSDLTGIAADAHDKLVRKHLPFNNFNVHCFGQQSPNPDSRILLGDEQDALGIPRPVLDWQLNELDRYSIRRTLELFGQELGRLHLGRLRVDFDEFPTGFYYGNHHMGTTRMSKDPRQGVVDADGKVHGVDNLFIAGSSVFPTSGTVPPTLTIVALALRLADHLRSLPE